MMKMKKLAAALLAVVMLVSMLSCMVLGASAATVEELGGPVTIEKAPTTGIAVGGKTLPSGILIVDDDWADCEEGDRVRIKLGGGVYTAVFGANAFADLATAAPFIKSNYTVYIAAGLYPATASLPGCTNVKIYGPWAGVNPNSAEDIALPNAARPAADVEDTTLVSEHPEIYNEAVLFGNINVNATQYRPSNFIELAGLYFAENSYIYLAKGSTYSIAPRVHNNIISVTKSYFMDFGRGNNPGMLFENNRVLRGKTIASMGGFMDFRMLNNYLNLSIYNDTDSMDEEVVSASALYISSFTLPAAGTYALVEGNYFENCAGIVRHDRGYNGYNTCTYSLQIRNNRIANVVEGSYLIRNRYYSMQSLPGITIEFTGNTVEGIPANTTLFQLPYSATQFNLNRYRYMVNINNNSFDLPAGYPFMDAEMAGVVDATDNVFKNGIEMDQVIHADDCEVLLYPYKTSADGVEIGAPKITAIRDTIAGGVAYSGSILEDEKKVVYDLTGADVDVLDLDNLLEVDEGCSFKVYKEASLATKIDSKAVYLDGHETVRYIVVSAPDGATSLYTMNISREYGTEAQLLDVDVAAGELLAQVTQPAANRFVVDIKEADLAFLSYTLNVSAGASYELYEDYTANKKLVDLGEYIPYGGYAIEVLVKSEDGLVENLYTVEFNRKKSALYDPSIVSITNPADGQWALRPLDGLWMYYFCNGLTNEETFEFATTPGATYTIYSDSKLTTAVSSQAEPKALTLKPGVNTFYVKVVEGNNSNVVYFEVVNDVLSSDAAIEGISGNQPTIIGDDISLVIGGNSVSMTFLTTNDFAVCEVYADKACTLKMPFTEVETPDLTSDRVMKTRTFSLETVHSKSVYFVKCIAEDGVTSRLYNLNLSKVASNVAFTDVPANEWYASYVATAAAAGVIAGESAGEGQIFRPTDNTTREEIAVIMSRLVGINGTAYAEVKLGYKDEAKISEWALNYVKVCKANGLMGGSGEKNGVYFYPAKNITREEVMVIFARMFNMTGAADLSVFKDANKVSDWAKEGVQAVVASGLINGDQGYLKPKAAITRAEIATIATRALDY